MPKAQVREVVCDTCGLNWWKHRATDTEVPIEECVRLLREDLFVAQHRLVRLGGENRNTIRWLVFNVLGAIFDAKWSSARSTVRLWLARRRDRKARINRDLWLRQLVEDGVTVMRGSEFASKYGTKP